MRTHYPYAAVLPLSWVSAKRRPSQLDSNKNTPSTTYTVGPEGPEFTPAPEDTNEGDFKDGS